MADQEQTKYLDQETLKQEIADFVSAKGYTSEYLMKNEEEFQDGLIEYLIIKGYRLSNILATLKELEGDHQEKKRPPLPKKINKLSEKLNGCEHPFKIFEDTTTLIPGMVIYTVEKIETNTKKPYTIYRPTPRVITQIHDSGVNGGTVFLTYEHKFMNFGQFDNKFQVISEDEVLYSPLTYAHARYICMLLNIQSKNMYNEKIKEWKEAQKKKMLLDKKSNQKTK